MKHFHEAQETFPQMQRNISSDAKKHFLRCKETFYLVNFLLGQYGSFNPIRLRKKGHCLWPNFYLIFIFMK